MRDKDREALLDALNHPRLERILEMLRDWIRKRGQPPARIQIETPEEAEALHGLVGGRPFRARSVATADFERRLRENSRFKCDLRQLVEVRFGTIVSRGEERHRTDTDWNEAFSRLQEVACRNAPADLCRHVFRWLEADRQAFRRRYNRQGCAALEYDLRIVIAALSHLPERGRTVLLAELAEAASHDPHAFDAGQSAASLLDMALAYWFPQKGAGERRTARQRRLLLARAGIQRDSISSRVDTFGLLISGSTDSTAGPARLDQTWTLRGLRRIRDQLRAAEGIAWVVENPTVFESLLDRLETVQRDFDPTLICTNGRHNLADEVLLDALVEQGARILYSGDFDADGLQIALDLRDRHPNWVQLWRMDASDYRSAIRSSSPKLRWKGLARARVALPDLVTAMEKEGCVGYQESMIETLFNDLARFTRTHAAPVRKMTAR